MAGSVHGRTALVTGAAGFIGSHLSAGLIDRGYRVLGLDTLETGSMAAIRSLRDHDRFRFERGDIRDTSLVSRLLESSDLLFHQAALTSVGMSYDEPSKTADINCTGTSVLLSSLRESSLDSVVVASSAAVYASDPPQPVAETAPIDPASPYALSKFWTERLAMQFEERTGADVTALRYFNVYGPGQDPTGPYASVVPAFVSRVREGEAPTIYGDGEQTRDFVHVDDVARANIAIAESDVSGEIYNVGSGERTSIHRLAELAIELAGADVEPQYSDPRPGDVRHSCADVTKIRREIGFEPTVELEAGLKELLNGHPETGHRDLLVDRPTRG